MKTLLLIGDTHMSGNPEDKNWIKYCNICKKAEGLKYESKLKREVITLSVGDNGFRESYKLMKAANKDPERHLWLQGNHDYYGTDIELPNVLRDYGLYVDKIDSNVRFYYVRGAHSIDRSARTEGFNWFKEEELETGTLMYMLPADYEIHKPSVMVTHDCPDFVRQQLFGIDDSTSTSKALEELYNIHQPDVWYFGHHHFNAVKKIGKTTFMCIAELNTVEHFF